VLVRLTEATPITGGLSLELLEIEGETRKPPRRKPSRPGKGKPASVKRGKIRSAKPRRNR
jgi:ribonuclease R